MSVEALGTLITEAVMKNCNDAMKNCILNQFGLNQRCFAFNFCPHCLVSLPVYRVEVTTFFQRDLTVKHFPPAKTLEKEQAKV